MKFKNETKLDSRGMVFSIEATIAALLFTLLILSLPAPSTPSLKELLITQQANDLLRVWSANTISTQSLLPTVLSVPSMITDTKLMFGDNAELYFNGMQILDAKKKKNSIATEGILVDSPLLNENTVKIIVYYD